MFIWKDQKLNQKEAGDGQLKTNSRPKRYMAWRDFCFQMEVDNTTVLFSNETEAEAEEVNLAGKDSLFEFVTEGVLLGLIQ